MPTSETWPLATQPLFHFWPVLASFLVTYALPLTRVVAFEASTRTLTFHGPVSVVAILQAWILPPVERWTRVFQWLPAASRQSAGR